ncbi:MAG TPA: uracil-xanthine permease, partial [Candidatus Scatomorpha intestinavium]|nr:uracil-xanthine permease [Candidatus Scatomorpha intestinavium]
MNRKSIGNEPIYDARQLGAPRMLVLGFQHMFAMFGATVLVPTLTGLSVSVTLLFAGLGTLLFHLLAKGKVPAFLGSSFAFIGGYAAIAPMLPDAAGNLTVPNTEMLPYACFGVVCAGLVYLVLAALFKAFGVRKVMRFFPPIVTGPIIISIGLSLSSSAVNNCQASWPVAMVAILVVIVCNIWGRGMVKIIPILLGVIVSYAVGAMAGQVDFTAVREAPWIGLPVVWDETVFSIFDGGADTG